MLNQLSCPVCGNPGGVAEFFEPRGGALCMRCGAIRHRLRNRLVFSYHLEPERITLERSLAKDFDSLDVVEFVMARSSTRSLFSVCFLAKRIEVIGKREQTRVYQCYLREFDLTESRQR
jgi:hypothetical protein